MSVLVLCGIATYLYCFYPFYIHNGWFLYAVLGCAVVEICRFSYEIYLKQNWIKSRTNYPDLEEVYGKVLDGKVYISPKVWAIEQSAIKGRFRRQTAKLGAYGVLLIIMFLLVHNVIYFTGCFILALARLELNRQHALVIDELGTKIQRRCRDSRTNQVELKH